MIYCLSYILMSIQHKILTFPFNKYIQWIRNRRFIDASNVSLHFMSNRVVDGAHLYEFHLKLNSCFPWTKSAFTKKSESRLPKPLPITTFAKYLVKGEMMAFLPNV